MVIVIGGGIIGASIADELALRGAQVTVLEKDIIGHGCSYGNAGWMTPCFAMPLPMPGMLMKSAAWLLNPESPLYIQPKPSLLLFQWLMRFMSSMNEKQASRAIAALVDLSVLSLKKYQKLAAENPAIGFEKKGLLMVGQSKAGLNLAVEEMNLVSRHNIPGRQLHADEIRQLEPSLVGHLAGGVYFPEEAHAEPLAVVQALAARAQKNGVRIVEKTEALDFEYTADGKKISTVITNNGRYQADTVILATGSWSNEIAKKLHLSVPILGGKGYSLIVPKLNPAPKHPMMLVEKKIAITPREATTRIAGTLELVNQNFDITQRRVNAIIKGAREFLPVPEELKIIELWRGLRPCTPDGVPMIGFSRSVTNLMLAAGHQMLGLQSGMGTGSLVADLVEGKTTDADVEIFRPDRF